MWEKYQGMYAKFNLVKTVFLLISGVCTMLMMFMISADVILRNVTGRSFTGCYELVQGYLMILVSVPAFIYSFSAGTMPRVDILIGRYSEKVKRIVVTIIIIIDIILMGAFAVFSGMYAVTGFAEKTVFIAGVSFYPVYFLFPLVPIAFVMIAVENVFILIRNTSTNTAEMTTGLMESENLFIN